MTEPPEKEEFIRRISSAFRLSKGSHVPKALDGVFDHINRLGFYYWGDNGKEYLTFNKSREKARRLRQVEI